MAADGASPGPALEGPEDPLEGFSLPTRAWFTNAFAAPTPVQTATWAAIRRGEHALVVAPTGSGKTLAAFLWALDRLAVSAEEGGRPRPQGPRVLYISPLKALAADVERNLRLPLAGIRAAGERLGHALPQVRVAVRSGDTSPHERRLMVTRPPDILITTPESLFLLLTSAAREVLTDIRTVILDEVHVLAGSKRGAHLALSLERLDFRLPRPAQRVALSATVRPVEEVARWVRGPGDRPLAVLRPASRKRFDLQVVVPVPDLDDLGSAAPVSAHGPGAASRSSITYAQASLRSGSPPTAFDSAPEPTGDSPSREDRASVWPHLERRLLELILEHRSTLVFVNSRRVAERLTARLNEAWADQSAEQAEAPDAPPVPRLPRPGALHPAQVMAQSGAAAGAPATLARAHHGSVSKEQRRRIEEDLKAGRLPAVVATSSLELGIDMGDIDLVVQVGAPPSVAGGLQRVGRAGHQVDAVSRGVFLPTFRNDLVQTAVVVEQMRAGEIEHLRVPANPLDVLAQQIVAILALDELDLSTLGDLVRRAAPFTDLPPSLLEAVLDMLAGRYPSDEFAGLRPRIVWDRVTDRLSARPGAQRLAVTSGGTIPDRGLFGVFLAGGQEHAEGAGRRVGELDEEMVAESRVGDVFALGASSWRIEQITHDRVLVSPAPGRPGRLPFWKGEAAGRPAALGRAIGAFVRELTTTGLDTDAARTRITRTGLDPWAADNLLDHLTEQARATGVVPDDRTVVVERFRDELGDWRVVVHSPFGALVHGPWALAMAAGFRARFGVEVSAVPSDDGIMLRLPDVETPDGAAPRVSDLVVLDPDEIEQLVTAGLAGSAVFAGRFRECAARSLLLPRPRPDRRQPLWQQRLRAAQLLEIASRYEDFPVVLEAARECLQDVFDVPALVQVMRELRARVIHLREVETPTPSPYARTLLLGYLAQFLYEGDAPLAERRAAALQLDPQLLAELLGRPDGAPLRDLLDPDVLAQVEAELQHLTPRGRRSGPEGLADLLRDLGPLDEAELAARSCHPDRTGEPADPATVRPWLDRLTEQHRVIDVEIAGVRRWSVAEDAARLRDALGTRLPAGLPEAFLAAVPDPLGDLVSRHARTHGPFTAAEAADRFGLGRAVVEDHARRLVASGRLVHGELRPLAAQPGPALPRSSLPAPPLPAPALPERLPPEPCSGDACTTREYCDAGVLRMLRRRSLAAARADVEPVAAAELARFLPVWHGLDRPGSGTEAVLAAVEQLAGVRVPASALESLILPARVRDYHPALLDELTTCGEVVWSGHGALGGQDGWVALHPAALAPLTLPEPDAVPPHQVHPDQLPDDKSLADRLLDLLAGGGAYFFRGLSQALGGPEDSRLAQVIWDLVWRGLLTNDTLAPLRTHLSAGGVGRSRSPGPHRSRRPVLPTRQGPPTVAGRWSLLPTIEPDPTRRAHGAADVLLQRHGVLTRAAAAQERPPGGFGTVWRALSAFEESGRARLGYFVEGLGARQYAAPGAVDRLRSLARDAAAVAPAPVHAGPAPEPLAVPELTGAGTSPAPRAIVLAATDPANPFGATLPWPSRDRESGGTAEGADLDRDAPEHRPGRKAGAVVVLVDGVLALYLERGGRSLVSWTSARPVLDAAARALAGVVRSGALDSLTVLRANGRPALSNGREITGALLDAGFHPTPQGLRIRR